MTSPVAGLVTSIVLPWPSWRTASPVACPVVVVSATVLLLRAAPRQDYPAGYLAKGEGKALHAWLRQQRDSWLLHACEIQQLVQPLAAHRHHAAVDVGTRLVGARRPAVDQHPQPARDGAA